VQRRENGAGADRIDPDAVHSVVQRQTTGRPATAALVVLYWRLLPPAIMARTEAILTILPPPAWRIAGMAALAPKT
jgi:hypothetical protein